MKAFDFPKYWHAFLRWKGWKALAQGCIKIWQAVARWQGWRKLLFLPVKIALLLFVACAAALVWIFLNDLEQWWPAYMLYGLSAYSLVVLCVRIPGAIKRKDSWLENHQKLAHLLQNRELKFQATLYFKQFLNFGYGSYKIAAGVIIGSAWIGADGIYNLVQALIQLFLILRRKKTETLGQQWRSYGACGWLILLMHLTLTGIVFQTVNWNRAEGSGQIMLIATATFAFYKFISSVIALAKDRKHTRPVDSAVRMLELSQAGFAMFSLQAGLLHAFGTGESWEYWLNLAVGCIVCLLTAAMGVYMIRRAKREINTIQEK